MKDDLEYRYFFIEPQFSDPDTFCHIFVGSGCVRASINIYVNISMLLDAAAALEADSLHEESPWVDEQYRAVDDTIFDFQLTVMPHDGGQRVLRFFILQELLDDGAPFRADIRFQLSAEDAVQFAKELRAWCENPEYTFFWKD